MAAGAFVDSVGVNAAPGTPPPAGRWPTGSEAAGIRHVRGPAATGPDDPALAGLRALAGADLQLDLVVGAEADPEAAVEAAASLGAAVAALEAPAGERAPLRRAVAAHPRLPGVAVLGSGPGVDYQAVRLELGGRCPGCAADELGSGDAAVQVTEVDLGAGRARRGGGQVPAAAAAGQRRAGRPHLRGGPAAATPGPACSTRPAPPPRPTMPWPGCSPCSTTAAGSTSRATCASG